MVSNTMWCVYCTSRNRLPISYISCTFQLVTNRLCVIYIRYMYCVIFPGEYTLPKVVFKAKGGHNLLNVQTLREICQFDDQHSRYFSKYNSLGCPSYSLGFFVSVISGKNCSMITDADVEDLIDLLQDCVQLYSLGLLTESCSGNSSDCMQTPLKCRRFRIPLYTFEYLTDRGFYASLLQKRKDKSTEVKLKYTSLFVTSVYGKDILDMFTESLEGATKKDWKTIKVVGIDIGDQKYDLFEQYLMEDIIYFALAAFLIVIVMCCYLKSLVITIATILSVGFSFLLAYFFYHIVCRFEFFPFLNLLSVLVLLGVGADDVFIFVDVWYQEKMKADPNNDADMTEHLYRTLQHALLTIFVTSLTTSAAFFSNAISSITAVRCFAIFAGIAIMANFLLMVTWFPAVLVMDEWLSQFVAKHISRPFFSAEAHKNNRLCWLIHLPGKALDVTFKRFLPFVITKFWYIWLLLLTLLGAAGLVLVFYKPKLSLPSSGTFQLFHEDHPIERFEMEVSKAFRYTDNDKMFADAGMRAAYIWGVKNVDNGNHVNPDSTGHLVYDEKFDLSAPEAQVWMAKQCEHLKQNASFLSDYSKSDLCLMQVFEIALGTACSQFPDSYQDCCETTFPLAPSLFKKCFPSFLYILPTLISRRPMDYPLFDPQGNVKVYIIDFYSNISYSTSYSVMGHYADSLNNFLDDAVRTAPKGLKRSWVYSDLTFYDLQRALSIGTYIAFGMSLGTALLVILLTSLNLVLSLYAVINIGFSIAVTVGLLVLLGWKLNILESITLSLAIGLSIDFSIHYAVAYRLCDSMKPSERVIHALSRVGPAIAMASMTTFLAGAAIMGTRILAYTQLGTFLMIAMIVSWLFATFFFLPLCSVAGPRGNCAQVASPSTVCKDDEAKAQVTENTRF